MKRVITLLSAIILVTAGSSAMAAMSISNVRKNARFLSDRMAHELRLTPAQYNDIYEINYDFIYSVRNVMNDVVRGYDPAIDRYYYFLDLRNEDLRWVLSNTQYRRFLANEAFYRPIYTSGSSWNFRVYVTYHNHNYFYYGKPTHYRTYAGRPAPAPGHVSRYHKKYNHTVYNGKVTVNNRRSDFSSGSTGTTTNNRRTGTSSSTKNNKVNSKTNSGTSSSSNSRRVSSGSTTTSKDNNKSTSTSTGTSSRRSSVNSSSSESSRSSSGNSVSRSSSSSSNKESGSSSSSSSSSSSRRSSGSSSTSTSGSRR